VLNADTPQPHSINKSRTFVALARQIDFAAKQFRSRRILQPGPPLDLQPGRMVKLMERHRPTILIADDHTLVAEACGKLLQAEFDVVGVVQDGRTLLEVASEMRPDVVITDIAMPQLNGLDAGEQLKQKNPRIKLIFLTMNVRPDVAAEAFRRGASGYVVKHCSAEDLIVAVRRALKGASYLSPQISKETVDRLRWTGAKFSEEKRLTDRQREVLQLLAEGKTMREVAYALRVRYGTVSFHKCQIMEALGLSTNAELIQYAIRHLD
jgi:DNA-binding NarL/FixJ family response regulator